MIEFYSKPKFSSEASLLKERIKLFHYYQVADPEEFDKVNAKNEIKLSNNIYHKKFNLIAN